MNHPVVTPNIAASQYLCCDQHLLEIAIEDRFALHASHDTNYKEKDEIIWKNYILSQDSDVLF